MWIARSTVLVLVLTFASSAAATDTGAPSDLHDGLVVSVPAATGLDPKPFATLGDAVAGGEFPKTNAVLVAHDGKLIYEAYFNDGTPDLLNDTRSAMKSVTALAAGIAIADGAIGSDHALVFPYFRDLTPFANDTTDKEKITIADLLTMSSALDCNDDDAKSPGNEDNMHPQQNWTRWAVDLPTMRGYARDATGLGPWRYCTTGAFLLGQVIQRATHVPIDKYIEAKLLAPLGITRWQWPYSPSGEVMTGGGLRLRSRDLLKLAILLADDGRWHGRQIVPAAWVDAALSAHRTSYAPQTYGYFFWHRDYQGPCGPVSGWYMAGNGGNAVVVLKELHAAVVVARANYNTHGMHQETVDLIEKHILPVFPCQPAK
jgi:CubicO group peptidase (beta-lactamase class C family)